MGKNAGVLYIVATPIGNLQDISARALDILGQVARIAAEDTRHSKKLLSHYGINTPMAALHEHNEVKQSGEFLRQLESGNDLALISDAGTPLISDPGYHLVQAARAAGVRVVPVPGPSAGIAALSAAGLPSDRFVFEGFLPPKQAARRQRLEVLRDEPRTLVFFESPHRVVDCLDDMVGVFGADRQAVIARELSKLYETIEDGTLAALCDWISADRDRLKGEFVILVHGAPVKDKADIDAHDLQVLHILLQELPLKQAAALAARITGVPKNRLYEKGIELKKDNP